MKKLFPLVTGLCFVALSLVFQSWAVAPQIVQVTAVSNPAQTLTPTYSFHSDQPGTITYGGMCGDGWETTAVAGTNTVTYGPLTNGVTYSNCTIRVVNANGEGSNILHVNVFTIQLSNAPVITEVTPVPNPTGTLTPAYTFHSTQGGTINFAGSCGTPNPTTAIAGNNTITYGPLTAGQTYSDCKISVTNTNGEQSNTLELSAFTVTTGSSVPPVITEVTPISNPSTTLTPSYTFHSTQAGTITYGGTCGNATPTTAVAGNNTVTYSLVNGQTYSNCTIRVVNANGEGSNTLSLGVFTVNTGGGNPPVITEVTPISNPSTTLTPSYTFHSTQAGTITYGGTCGNATPTTAVAGNNTVTYSLVNGQTYSNCTIRVVNSNGEGSNILSLGVFTVNTGAGNGPIITEVTPIPNPSTTTTPSYTFHSTQAGAIVYGGSCGQGSPIVAFAGNNTVTYSLNDGQTYSDCTIQVTNINGNSNILSLGVFTVNTGANPPVITEVTPIPNPSTTTTPSYTFHSTQAGTITYGGTCGNATPTTAVAGNNTVTYSLIDGQSYTNCTIRVVNANGEGSNILSLGTFLVNTGANPPVLTEVTPIPNPSTTVTPSYTFHSTQAGTIYYNGSCGNGDLTNVVMGNNTVMYSLTNGQTYNDCTIRVVNADGDQSNTLSLGTFFVNQGGILPVIAEVTPIPNPSTTVTPTYIFSSTQAGNIVYGGSCGIGSPTTAIVGNNTVTYSLTDGQTYSDCTIQVLNSNGGSNVLGLSAFTVNTNPVPPTPPSTTGGGGNGSGKAGMRFSGQRRDDYARSGKFWDMSKSIADIERINEGYLGRVTTYINDNGFRVFAGYLPGKLSLDYLNSRIERTQKFVYRGERDQRSGNTRVEKAPTQETHPQTYFRNRWAHNAIMGIQKAVAWDPKEEAMKMEGGQDWIRSQWRRGGVWARDHVSVNTNFDPSKPITILPEYLPRLSIKEEKPISLGVRRVALEYTAAKGVSRIRPVRIESAASPAYEVYVTDDKEPWADDEFFNRGETLEIRTGQGTGERTIRIEMALNPAYPAVIESSQAAWEQSFLNRTDQLRKTIQLDSSFVKPDSSVNRVPVLNSDTGVSRVTYNNDLERWRAYKIEKANRPNPWERRPYLRLQENS